MGNKRNKNCRSRRPDKRTAHSITNQPQGDQDYNKVTKAVLHLMSQDRKEFGLIALVSLTTGQRLEEVLEMTVDDVTWRDLPLSSFRHIIGPYIQSISEAQSTRRLFNVSPKEYRRALKEAGASHGIQNLRHNDLRRHFIEELVRGIPDAFPLHHHTHCCRIDIPTHMCLSKVSGEPFTSPTYPELPNRDEE